MVNIGGRVIDETSPCFITFEAGPTHDGVDSAKRLIKAAKDAGGDAVKFQVVDPDRLVADRQQLFSYGVLANRETGEVETISEPLYDILMRRVLTHDEWREVKAYADQLGLAFFATATFEDEIELLAELGCHSLKIASADVNHVPLLRDAAHTGMCIQLDTGNSTIGEIEAAVDIVRGCGNENIIIHHCPSGYPAHLESINLRVIPTLRGMFPYPIAYSDHSAGWEMDIAAIAMGAKLVEKTITEDRMTRSVEHVMSLEPQDMAAFVRSIRDVETAMGTSRRLMSEEERLKRDAVRRSAFLDTDTKAGTPVSEAKVVFRRPGFGIAPDRFDFFYGAVVNADLPAGHRLRPEDFSWPRGTDE